MDLAGKRFLLVGGAGFIGSHVADALLSEDVAEVRIYDNFSRGSEENLAEALGDPRVRVFELGGEILARDLLDAAMKGIDGVFHFAALWLLHCYEYPRSAFEVNIGGTFNVIEACLANGVKRLVHSSSTSVYGDALAEPMTEQHPYNNTTSYGATKIAGEHMLRALHHRYRESERRLDYVGLRYIGDGSQAYDFVYVGDCARANVLAMRAETSDAFYNVGTGTKTSVRELAELLVELSGNDVGIEQQPAGQTFVRNRIGSTEKAARELGFRACVPLREGLAQLIEWRHSHREQVVRRRRTAGPTE